MTTPSPDEILAELRQRQAGDLPVVGGTTLAYVYDSGLTEVDRASRTAVADYAGSNGLDPTAFPSLLAMENEVVGFAADLVQAPEEAVGSVTSGGTESVLLAVQTARDARPEISRPRMVLPATAHPAFHKAAHYFGVEPDFVAVGADFRADPAAVAAAIGPDTVLVVASAPSYAHGVVDPVAEMAAAAADRGVRCHVDACIGGWVLPFAAESGRSLSPWDFRVPGVTSISVDLHKYGYTPKGVSVLLHRSSALRQPQFFASARWPGYTMLNSTLQSTKSGGPLAGAWTAIRLIGRDGYRRLASEVFSATDQIVAGLATIDQLSVVAHPDATLVAIATGDTCDPFTITDELANHGWFVQPQMSFSGPGLDTGPTIHLSVSAATLPRVGDFLTAVRAAVAAAVERGPVAVDPGVLAVVGQLDPGSMDPETFGQLLAGTGLVSVDDAGGLRLPEQMAPINALLDAVPSAVRETLMTAFLDQLSRPVRGAGRL